MSRVQFIETVVLPTGPGGSLVPVPGIAATPYTINPDQSEGPQAAAYAGRTGNAPAASLTTDATGTVRYWLDSGDYNIHFDDTQQNPRVASWVQGFDAAIIDTNTLVVAAQNLIQFTGDYKWSEQAADHGQQASGAYEWLLVSQDAVDGGGRKVLQSDYTALWQALGSPAIDANGNFRLPNVSGRVLLAANLQLAASGMNPRARRTMAGSEVNTISASNLPPHTHVVSIATLGQSSNHVHAVSGTTSTQSAGHQHGGSTDNWTPANDPGFAETAALSIFSYQMAGGSSGNWAPGIGSNAWGGAHIGHTHTFTTGSENTVHTHTWSGNSGGAVDTATGTVYQDHTHQVSGSTGNGPGTGVGFSILNPIYTCNLFIKT